MRKQARNWEKMFAKHFMIKDWYPKYAKKHLKPDDKKANNPN